MTDRQHYHVEDLDAADFGAALALLQQRLPADVARHADLLELRRRRDAEDGQYGPE